VIVETIWTMKKPAIQGMAGVMTIGWRRSRMSYASGAARMSGTAAATATGTLWNWTSTTGALL
jgi:hypothetical protein